MHLLGVIRINQYNKYMSGSIPIIGATEYFTCWTKFYFFLADFLWGAESAHIKDAIHSGLPLSTFVGYARGEMHFGYSIARDVGILCALGGVSWSNEDWNQALKISVCCQPQAPRMAGVSWLP